MKIKPDHLNHLKLEIDAVLQKYPGLVTEYENGQFPRAETTKDLQRRFCFDLLFGAGLNKFVIDHLYEYMNDDHLYTALKSICPTVQRRF